MVIRVLDIVDSASTAEQGTAVYDACCLALRTHDVVTVSFDGVHTATSSFTNAFIVPLLNDLTFDGLKRRIAIIQSNYQINDVIRRRVAWELQRFPNAA